jgi:hypothetical protein
MLAPHRSAVPVRGRVGKFFRRPGGFHDATTSTLVFRWQLEVFRHCGSGAIFTECFQRREHRKVSPAVEHRWLGVPGDVVREAGTS